MRIASQMMLVQADPGGKREVRTHAHEHPAPAGIVHVEVKLVHPPLLVLQMRTVVVFIPDGHKDASRFPRFQDGHHLARFGVAEVRLNELVATTLVVIAFRSLQNRSSPFLSAVLEPILKLIGDFRQGLSGYP
jgi:hypothetical protein